MGIKHSIRNILTVPGRTFRRIIHKIPSGSWIEKNVKLSKVVFGGYNHIGANSTVYMTEIGYGSGISKDSFFQQCKIGKYVCIGPDVKMIIGEHPSNIFASIHPAFYAKRGQMGVYLCCF